MTCRWVNPGHACEEGRPARHARALAEEGAEDLRGDARLRSRAVRLEERAHRTAWSAVKHVAEKRGDHWELKDEPGPSDPQAAKGGREARERPSKTYGGVDVEGSTKEDLYERAKELDIDGRSNMSKEELAESIAKRQ